MSRDGKGAMVKELGGIIKAIYEHYELLSRWTPELTAKEFLIILAMRADRNYRVSELAEMTAFPMSTTSFLVDSLVSKKIVSRRRRTDDRRVVSIRLTEKGRRALCEYETIFERIADRLLCTLSKDEASTLLQLLRKVVRLSTV
jgi:DNA-binding MarR family transcriptional regulator